MIENIVFMKDIIAKNVLSYVISYIYDCPHHSVFHQQQQSPHNSTQLQGPWCLGSSSSNTQRDWANSSRLYKVNIWMWRYCRGSTTGPGWCPSQRLRGSGTSVSSRAGPGQQSLQRLVGSDAARLVLLPALPRALLSIVISYLVSNHMHT